MPLLEVNQLFVPPITQEIGHQKTWDTVHNWREKLWLTDWLKREPHLGNNLSEKSHVLSVQLWLPTSRNVTCSVFTKHTKLLHKSAKSDRKHKIIKLTRTQNTQMHFSPKYFYLEHISYWSEPCNSRTSLCANSAKDKSVLVSQQQYKRHVRTYYQISPSFHYRYHPFNAV